MHRKCICCGNGFTAKSVNAKYCPKCRIIMRKCGKDQPCWTCDKYAGGCSWSKNFTPVKGWKAIEVQRKTWDERYKTGYRIIHCPEYVRSEE